MADVTDRQGTLQALGRCGADQQEVRSLLADGGYVGQPFVDAAVQIAKRSELRTFAAMPLRWLVERSFAWIEKCRRLWKNCERKLNTSLQFIHLALLA